MQYRCEYHYVIPTHLRGIEARAHLYMYGSDGPPTSHKTAIIHRACFGCGIDVKSDDGRALDNAEANDVVVVWKAFLEEC